MNIYNSLDGPFPVTGAAVTTGSFDGVHIGHKAILKRLRIIADNTGGETVLITFHPHPRKVLFPETAGRNLRLINTQREKTELLKTTGLDHLLVIPFTQEFSKMSSIDFIRKILVGKLKARTVVIGFNHHFGHNREGDFEILYQLGRYHGFNVEEIPEQDIENETVSSTRIRKALQEGKIQRANAYLDHYYMIMGQAMPSAEDTGMPVLGLHQIIIEEEEKLIPPPGIYAGTINTGELNAKAMVMIRSDSHEGKGARCSFLLPDHPELRITADSRLLFHKMIREERNFSNDHDLIRQLNIDKQEIIELIY